MGNFDFEGLLNHLMEFLEKLFKMFFQTKSWLDEPGSDNSDWEEQ